MLPAGLSPPVFEPKRVGVLEPPAAGPPNENFGVSDMLGRFKRDVDGRMQVAANPVPRNGRPLIFVTDR